jgi:hypothetical protein
MSHLCHIKFLLLPGFGIVGTDFSLWNILMNATQDTSPIAAEVEVESPKEDPRALVRAAKANLKQAKSAVKTAKKAASIARKEVKALKKSLSKKR